MLAILRFDASKDQGLGHLVRSMALADAAIASGWSVEVCGNIENPAGLEMIAGRTETIYPAPRTSPELAHLAVRRRAHIVHIDSYEEQIGLREAFGAAGIPVSSMEDGTNGRRPADLVVDPSPSSELSFRPGDGSMRLFRGLKAIPLRRSILNMARPTNGTPMGHCQRVMIVMGGTDARNLTNFMVQCWLDTGLDAECHVVAQPNALKSCDPAVVQKLVVHEPGPHIPALFPEMDLVVTASGTTIWELAYLGTPMAIVQVVENQDENYRYATSQGMAAGLGSLVDGSLSHADVVGTLQKLGSSSHLRGGLSASAQHLVDGTGSRNILAQWSQLAASPTRAAARVATVDDASILFEWRNDAAVRDVSRNSGELSWEGHVAWLQSVLATPSRWLLIVESERNPIGTVRFDAQEPSTERWEVSITLSPHVRGQGMGKAVLAAGEAFLADVHPTAKLFAEMLETNEASHRLFKTAGYSGSIVVVDGQRWYSLEKESI